MTLPVLTIKYWTGASGEYFQHTDMTRVNSNANIIATACSVSTVSFDPVTRASQFDYSEFQALENLITAIAAACGTAYTAETSWAYKHSVSYADFERVEYGLFLAYKALGGQGERVAPTQYVTIERHTLNADDWQGSYPKYQDITVLTLYASTDSMVFMDHTNGTNNFISGVFGLLRPSLISDNQMRVYADGITPTMDIDIIITTEILSMQTEFTLSTSGWSGTGPYTKSIAISGITTSTIGYAGTSSSASASEHIAYLDGNIRVSGVSAGHITIECSGVKPTISIPMILVYENDVISEG